MFRDSPSTTSLTRRHRPSIWPMLRGRAFELCVICRPCELPSRLGRWCLCGATDRTTVTACPTLPLPVPLCMPRGRPVMFGSPLSRSVTLFTDSTRLTRLPTLPRLKCPFPRIPPVSPVVPLVLIPCRMLLISDSMLFTLRTCRVVWLGRKGLSVLSPLLVLMNPTGVLAMQCIDSVVLLWVLLLAPARIMLANGRAVVKVPVAVVVLRLATVLIMNSALIGPTVVRMCVTLLTTVRLMVSWLVALMTSILMQSPWVVLTVCVMTVIGLLLVRSLRNR